MAPEPDYISLAIAGVGLIAVGLTLRSPKTPSHKPCERREGRLRAALSKAQAEAAQHAADAFYCRSQWRKARTEATQLKSRVDALLIELEELRGAIR